MKRGFIVIGITLLAFFLRFYQVTQVPPSLSWDEVSIGYNAYSILKTGRDEHGRFLPLDTFTAFGDYKPPIPIYLTVPFIAIFGLNELAIRLPSVTTGTLTVLLTYFLVGGLFQTKGQNATDWHKLALLSMLLLAISPWHVQLSRAGFEANIALLLVVLGAVLTLKSQTQPRYLWFCVLPFVAAIYTFNSARYFTPLLLLGLFVYQLPLLKRNWRKLVVGLVVATIFVLPILSHLLSPQARLRFAEVNIFTDPTIVQVANDRINAEQGAWWARVLHNRRVGYARSYLIHFLDHFQPWFLFIRGDGNPKFSLQDVGQLYLVEFPFLVLGIYFLAVKQRKIFWLLLFWLLAAIVPAAVARETPHALRIENSLPVWQIFIAFGIVSSIKYLLEVRERQVSKTRAWLLFLFIAAMYLANFTYFRHNYFNHYPREYSGEWQYGYREAIRYAARLEDQYERIILSENIGRPYIYVLFYRPYDPAQVAQNIDSTFDAAGFYNVARLGKYHFVRGKPGQLAGKNLYVLPPAEVPLNARILETVKLLNGKPVLVIFDNI